jgi:hypothetical protein
MELTFASTHPADTATALKLTFDTTPGNGWVIVTVESPSGSEDIRVPLSLMQTGLQLFYNAPPS